jgi:MYXO-CTERM domain-containing protein
MKKLFWPVFATAVLLSTFGSAQSTARPQSNDNPTQYEYPARHDYGWIGLLGLVGLGGLIRRRERGTAETRNIDSRRVA